MKQNTWILILLAMILIASGFMIRKLYRIEEKVTRTNKFVFEAMQDAKTKELHTIQPLDLNLGSAETEGTIIMYTDLSCTHCDEFFETTFREIKTGLIETGKTRFVIRYLVNPNDSLDVLKTIEAYCETDSIINTEGQHPTAKAKSGSSACRTSADIRSFILENSRKARLAGISLTPTFIVNGIEISGSRKFAKFEELLNNTRSVSD